MLNALELAAGRAQEASLTGLPSSAVLDHSKVYVSKEAAFESMRRLQARHASCTAVYEYWLSKRRKLGMPLLRQFQPSVPLTDNDPYKVFRPRDKPTRPHTRRKRENDLPSYQRLYTVRQNLEAAARLFAMVHRRERCKREALDVAVELANARLMRAHGADAALPDALGHPRKCLLIRHDNFGRVGPMLVAVQGASADDSKLGRAH